MPTSSLILFNKPYGVQSQFRDDSNNDHATLSQYFTDKSLRVAGRLDATSEGLLILTDDKQGKTYLVQVEGIPTAEQLNQLKRGVTLKDGKTLPAKVKHVSEDELPMALWQRHPPIRERKSVPDSWLMLTIYEGKNRQVRRMTAHVGLPCLRLIRWSVAGFELGDIAVGEFVRIHLTSEHYQQLGISY